MKDEQGFRTAVRDIPCFTSVDQHEILWRHAGSFTTRKLALAQGYPDFLKEGGSWRAERLDTVFWQILDILKGKKLCLPHPAYPHLSPAPPLNNQTLPELDDSLNRGAPKPRASTGH
jgi:hypothetical protein